MVGKTEGAAIDESIYGEPGAEMMRGCTAQTVPADAAAFGSPTFSMRGLRNMGDFGLFAFSNSSPETSQGVLPGSSRAPLTFRNTHVR
jgi:hypothetical protein